MAAFVALIGGTLAYFGAMAKVNVDSDRDRRELDRKKSAFTCGCFIQLRK
jgi:hypothetical protein